MTVQPQLDLKPGRRWCQYSVRTLLAIVLLASVGMSWFATRMQQARRQREAVEAIRESGGWVQYDYEAKSSGLAGPVWLRSLLGDDFFGTVVFAWVHTDKGLEHLEGLTGIEELDLSGGGPSFADRNGHAAQAYLFPPQRKLYISEVTDAGLEQIEGLKRLRRLSLSGSQITDAGLRRLKGLSQLQWLDLSGTQATDDGLGDLKGLSQLQWLNLSKGPSQIIVALRELSLDDSVGQPAGWPSVTRITDSGLAHLRELSQLRWLWLNGTQVTDAGLGQLKGLKKLTLLDLSDTSVTDAGLKCLDGLQRLRSLYLNGTRVTDTGLRSLKHLDHLQELRIERTGTTSEGVDDFRRAVPNCTVWYSA